MAGLSLTAHAACFLPYVCTRPAVFVVPLEGTKEAAVTFTLYDQNTEQPEHKVWSFTRAVGPAGFGFPKLISHDSLSARPGYLAGGTLCMRINVRVLA